MEFWNYVEENPLVIRGVIIALATLITVALIIRIVRNIQLIQQVTSIWRGTKSERKLVLKLLRRKVPALTIFHDLYVRKPNGKFAQIDVAVATTQGIILFEVKDYKGWILGHGKGSTWTQVLAYGKRKYRFYNPIKQNQYHINALKKQLPQFQQIPFFSVIVFFGKCELKEITYVPKNTFVIKASRLSKVLKILRKKYPDAPYSNKRDVVRVLKQAVQNGKNKEYVRQHRKDVKDLLGAERVFK